MKKDKIRLVYMPVYFVSIEG